MKKILNGIFTIIMLLLMAVAATWDYEVRQCLRIIWMKIRAKDRADFYAAIAADQCSSKPKLDKTFVSDLYGGI